MPKYRNKGIGKGWVGNNPMDGVENPVVNSSSTCKLVSGAYSTGPVMFPMPGDSNLL